MHPFSHLHLRMVDGFKDGTRASAIWLFYESIMSPGRTPRSRRGTEWVSSTKRTIHLDSEQWGRGFRVHTDRKLGGREVTRGRP